MNIFKDKDSTFFVSPTLEKIKELDIIFKEEFDEIKYCFQIVNEENDYYSYIFYLLEGKEFIFTEYENPQHASFYSGVSEKKEDEFWKHIEENPNVDTSSTFFKDIRATMFAEDLENKLPKEQVRAKNIKL